MFCVCVCVCALAAHIYYLSSIFALGKTNHNIVLFMVCMKMANVNYSLDTTVSSFSSVRSLLTRAQN